ncbi:MAG: Arc family DNA-binding protein [Rhizobiaceae bacterium]|nr:Arc family DNA-binding protein [Rhizobiaceae bacterium]
MSKKPRYPSDEQAQFMVRMSHDLRERLKAHAKMVGRSMNAEIVDRLEASITWPKIDLPRDLFERALDLPIEMLLALEEEIQEMAAAKVERAVRDHRPTTWFDFVHSFYDLTPDLDKKDQQRLAEEMEAILERAGLKSIPGRSE